MESTGLKALPKSKPAVFLRLNPTTMEALDRVVAHFAALRGATNRSDIVRELIMEADRKLRKEGQYRSA